ncbi:MAG TPA: type II secretion system protein [Tepidisphaeraceae bacterium]|nr:type II secretion system protein [Tepidisphaeraceae bacterium]
MGLSPGSRRAFTLIELLVVVGILIILASIFIPYALRARENSRRIVCRDNLQQIFNAMQSYAAANGSYLPRTEYDPAASLTAFQDRSSLANNVTSSLWLLVRNGHAKSTTIFLCPSLGGSPAPVSVDRTDFWGPPELGYSYATPFGQSESYRLTDTLKPQFVLMADRNPGCRSDIAADSPLLLLSTVNSLNHGQGGQNVLYAYGSVEWQITPYCGMNNDNIYTVRGARGATQPTTLPSKQSGVLDPVILPSVEDDTFLYPPKL